MDKTDIRIMKLMIEKIDRVISVVSNHTEEEIKTNYIYSDTLSYEFEKLYEDCTRLSPMLLVEYSNIPINELRSIRNRVAHDYESVIIQILISTAINDFPRFKSILESILSNQKEAV